MTLSRETELGTITVSNLLFAQIVADSFKLDGCRGKIWPSSKKGKQIGSDVKFNLSEFANNIEVEECSDERVNLEFYVIVKFGTSIRTVCETVSDCVAASIEQKHGNKPGMIKIHVIGVKSKQIAKRNLEVVKRYGTEC